MPFPFTFKLVVPGIPNPFAAFKFTNPAKSPPSRRTNFSPERSPSPVVLLPRKRRWQPSSAGPSQSSTTIASTAGYFATAKTDMTLSLESSEHEYDCVDPELPPPKRRRTLAGSIVSTAISACLIGTAVGLTVYRLWRNRGKQSQQITSPPPPPYEQEWTPVSPQPETVHITPSTSRSRKPRHTPHSLRSTKSAVHHRRTRIRPQVYSPPNTSSPSQPEFSHGHPNHEEEFPAVEDQMDWIGDKLTILIQEGKKALGREVVIMSDAKEDEVDDGTGLWEEENPAPPIEASPSRTGSIRRSKAPHPLPIPSPSHTHAHAYSQSLTSPPLGSSHSARSSRYDTSTRLPCSRSHSARSVSHDPNPGSSPSSWEDENAWTTPEMRESMEKARARFLPLRDRGM